MLKALWSLVIMIFLLLSCQHIKTNAVPIRNKPDLNKASSYNVQLGLTYLKQGNRPRAKKKLLTAVDQQPDSPDANAAIAYYFEQTKELELSRKYYLKAISFSSKSGAQLNNYGAFLCRQKQYKEAEAFFLKAVKDKNYIHTAGAYENAGLCALAIPDTDKAKLYFMQALNQDPFKKMSLYELVKLESKEGHEEKALELLQKYPDLVLNDRILSSLAKDLAKNKHFNYKD